MGAYVLATLLSEVEGATDDLWEAAVDSARGC